MLARQNAHELTGILRAAMKEALAYQAYEACEHRAGATCEQELSVLLYEVLGSLSYHIGSDAFDIGLAVQQFGPELTASALIEELQSAKDSVERVAVLHLLSDTESGLRPTELPPEHYRRLDALPVAEAQKVLERHVAIPVTEPETVRNLVALGEAVGTDSRLWGATVDALAHAETADQFRQVLLSRPITADNALAGAMAVLRCGSQCLPALTDLAARGGADGRAAAYRALTMLPADERQKSLETIATLAPHPSRWSDDEREAWRQLQEQMHDGDQAPLTR